VAAGCFSLIQLVRRLLVAAQLDKPFDGMTVLTVGESYRPTSATAAWKAK
jgi:hypothetical protein